MLPSFSGWEKQTVLLHICYVLCTEKQPSFFPILIISCILVVITEKDWLIFVEEYFLRKRSNISICISLPFPIYLGRTDWFQFLHTTTYNPSNSLLTAALFRHYTVQHKTCCLQLFAGGTWGLLAGNCIQRNLGTASEFAVKQQNCMVSMNIPWTFISCRGNLARIKKYQMPTL